MPKERHFVIKIGKLHCKQEKKHISVGLCPCSFLTYTICNKFRMSHMDEQLSAAVCGLMILPLQYHQSTASSYTFYESYVRTTNAVEHAAL